MRKNFFWLLAAVGAFAVVIIYLRFWLSAEQLASVSNGGTWLLPMVIVAALLDSINPCAFSVLLLTIAFLWQIGRRREHILRLGAVYIAGLFTVYILIGLGLLQVLHLFNTPHFMAKVGAALLIALGGLDLINYWWPRFPLKLKIPAASHRAMGALVDRASVPAIFALGALVGLCEFPCTGGPYLMILGLLHDRSALLTTTYLSGLGYLLLYNLLFISPLVIILMLASDRQLLDRVSVWQKNNQARMRLYTGIVLVAIGAFIFLL